VAAKTLADNTEYQNTAVQLNIELSEKQASLNDLSAGRVQTLADKYNLLVQSQSKATATTKANMEAQSAATIANLKAEKARLLDTGQTSSAAVIDQRIDAEQKILGLRLRGVDLDNERARKELLFLDTQTEGLNIQQQSLSYAEKYLEAIEEATNKRREENSLDLQIARRRRGGTDNESSQRADEIRAARDGLAIARQQAQVRKAIVGIEFALLDAQRAQLLEEMKFRLQMSEEGSAQQEQLMATVQNLERAGRYIEQARAAATAGVDQTVRMAEKTLQLALTPDRGRNSLANMRRERQRVRDEEVGGRRDLTNAGAQAQASFYVAPIVTSNAKLVTSTDALTDVNQKILDRVMATPAAARSMTGISGGSTGANAARFFMQRLGLTAEQAAGLAGNLQVESGFNPRAWNKGENAQGIAQWRGDRLTNFRNSMGVGALQASLDQQLEFVARELEGRFSAVLRKLKNAGSVDEAATLIDRKYEISAGLHTNRRITAGKNFLGEDLTRAIDNSVLPATLQTVAENTQQNVEATENVGEVIVTKVINRAANLTPEDVPSFRQPLSSKISDRAGEYNEQTSGMLAQFQEMADRLGPQGNLVPTIISGISQISDAYIYMQQQFETETNWGERFEGMAGVAQATISTISSILQQSSDARIAGIDAEIAAEQRRDGKSAQSVAKIESLERKKDAIAKKQFNIQKKMMMAQTIISTATAIAGQLASPPVGPWNIALAAAMGALGAAQLAIIAGTSYQSTSSSNQQSATPPAQLSIGNRGDQVDLAKNNANAGGEIGYLRGAKGYGRNASDYYTIGSAYGGTLPRGYGNTAFAVGEKGPEVITPDTPITVRPMDDAKATAALPTNVNFHIKALDAKDVEEVLRNQRGNLIGMLREAANANGEPFMEDVNVGVYTNPRTSRL
jgi:hypothetical protein